MKYSRGKIGDIEDRRTAAQKRTAYGNTQGATPRGPSAGPTTPYSPANFPAGTVNPRGPHSTKPGATLGNLASKSVASMRTRPTTARAKAKATGGGIGPSLPRTPRPVQGPPTPKPVVKAQAAKPKTSRPGANNPNARRAK